MADDHGLDTLLVHVAGLLMRCGYGFPEGLGIEKLDDRPGTQYNRRGGAVLGRATRSNCYLSFPR
jgi:hypothetical protein